MGDIYPPPTGGFGPRSVGSLASQVRLARPWSPGAEVSRHRRGRVTVEPSDHGSQGLLVGLLMVGACWKPSSLPPKDQSNSEAAGSGAARDSTSLQDNRLLSGSRSGFVPVAAGSKARLSLTGRGGRKPSVAAHRAGYERVAMPWPKQIIHSRSR